MGRAIEIKTNEDVVSFLKTQHEQVKTLFGAVLRTRGEARVKAFVTLRRMMAVHETAEEEIEHVIRLDQRIQTLQDGGVHLPRVCERTVAVANDIEVPQMKVGSKPSVSHNDVYAETLLSLI